jgi:hypothetical protein
MSKRNARIGAGMARRLAGVDLYDLLAQERHSGRARDRRNSGSFLRR